jgi:hypothetical protein
MDSFNVCTLRKLSEKQEKPRLLKVSNLIDWIPIRNKSEKGGRPNSDVILMFKNSHTSIVLWFKLSRS